MPVMDGYTAARKIRALEDPSLARIPIIALSANAFDEDREASYEAGMNAHLAKPIIVSELLDTLGKILFVEKRMIQIKTERTVWHYRGRYFALAALNRQDHWGTHHFLPSFQFYCREFCGNIRVLEKRGNFLSL